MKILYATVRRSLSSPDGLHDPIGNGRDAEVDSIHLNVIKTVVALTILARHPN